MKDEKKKWDLEDDNQNQNISETSSSTQTEISNYEPEHVEEIITGQLSKNVVLFIGPRQIGKTVALIRLTHYLNKNKKTNIKPNKTFRKDQKYLNSVNEFLHDLHTPDFSPTRTGNINFLVLDVFKDSKLYCQYLEAPGEAYYDPEHPYSNPMPPYLKKILRDSKTNKVFVFFYEDGLLSQKDAMAYSDKMAEMVRKMNRKKDDVIILFNKSDLHRELYRDNKPVDKQFKEMLYNNDDFSSFIGALNEVGIPVKFLPFTSGDFDKIPNSEKERWTHSEDFYPEKLWRTIDKCFKSWSLF